MKEKLIRTMAVFLLLAAVAGILPVLGSTQPVYSTQSNSGERDVICTTLDGTGAQAYYTGEYTYDHLSRLSEDALYDVLQDLLTDTHSKITSYSNCRDYATVTDCENGDGRVMLIYTSYSATRGEYINDTPGGWNREHIWPKSLGGFDDFEAGADLHHIRPSDSQINNTRGNKLYGEISGGTAAKASMPSISAMVGGYSTGNYFEPLDNVKGDVARICLYVYVRWAEKYPDCGDITNVFQNVDVLLEWCAEDPVDTWEMGRNEVVEEIQGNRNVFIDYPEYAWLLFGREIPDDITTPSGKASAGEEETPSCTHKNTEHRNVSSATCGKAGYSGDTYCKDCGEKLQSGSTIPATGNHSFGEWVTADDGSKSRTCAVCGKVETQSCTHENTEIRGTVSATCKEEGYSGDTYCKDCDKKLQSGSTIPVTGNHSFGEWIITDDGSKSRTCAVCGKVETETTPPETAPPETTPPETTPAECTHANVEYRNTVAPSCKEGYSGDVYCKDCGKFLEKGMVYPAAAAHEYGDPVSADGTQVCKICGHETVHKSEAEPPSRFPVWLIVAIPSALLIALIAMLLLIKKRKA